MVELTAAHWVYALFVVIAIVAMAFRLDIPLI